jgi:non-canonical purine NTP pyrophosphatase (RdgB/HAM1 family)
MKELIFSTGNESKFAHGFSVCSKAGIQLIQKTAEIPEIQDEDPEKVALDKAAKAFEHFQKPVVITDDSWSFAGLRGFPGVYMHSMNEWFTPDDFIRLVKPLENKKVTLTQYLIYADNSQQKVFKKDSTGKLLTQIQGHSIHPSHTIISMDGDDGLSIAEVFEKSDKNTVRAAELIWHDFAEWFTELD